MTYATELVQQYRLALQYIWNIHFWSDETYRTIESIRLFNEVKRPLFTTLVAKRLGPDLEAPLEVFGAAYKIVPKATWKSFPPIRVDVGFKDRPGQCWEQLHGEFTTKEMALTLLDLFDWNELDWRNFSLYRVRIDKLEGHPDKVGREGLVDVLLADVLWESPGTLGMPISALSKER